MNNDAYANEDATQELLRISKWPEPLRLAYLLEKEMLWPLHGRAADELRRLHAIETKLAEQPAQQEPVAAECKFEGTKEWVRCSVEHHNLVQSEPHKWPDYQTRLLYTSPPAQRKPLTVWTEAQHERAYRNSPELHKDVKSLAAFKRVAKEIAAMYGIKENT